MVNLSPLSYQINIYMRAIKLLLVACILAQALAFPFPSGDEITSKLVSFVDLFIQKSNKTSNDSCTQNCCASLPSRAKMTYYYYQNTGRFRGGSGEYAIDTLAYSGQGQGYNNPAKQCVVNTGPLPASTYKLDTCVNYMHQTVQRPCAFYLAPQKQDQMCGRNAFFIHGCACCTPGDDTNPPTAGCSAGCIVMNYANRKKLRVNDTLIVEHFEPRDEELDQE